MLPEAKQAAGSPNTNFGGRAALSGHSMSYVKCPAVSKVHDRSDEPIDSMIVVIIPQ
tara:strand:- start:6185 stop:6355 length:171 start_codon:yes stop_codon:yes gene_type:complete